MSTLTKMDVFEGVDYTRYREDIRESEKLNQLSNHPFKLDSTIDVYESKFEIPRVKNIFRSEQNAPKPAFYDLGILDGLPMTGDNVKVYHDMMNQFLATNTLNNISNYIKYGACVLKFEAIPDWVNYNAFLDATSELLRRIGRKTIILHCDGDLDCMLIQSKSFIDSKVANFVENVRNFILSSKNMSDYVNVTVNIKQLVSMVNPEEYRDKVKGCATRFGSTDRLVSKLERIKDEIKTFVLIGDPVSAEDSLCEAIALFAKAFLGINIDDYTLRECLDLIDQYIPQSKLKRVVSTGGKTAFYAISYIDRLLDAVEDFQVWGKRAC